MTHQFGKVKIDNTNKIALYREIVAEIEALVKKCEGDENTIDGWSGLRADDELTFLLKDALDAAISRLGMLEKQAIRQVME